MMPNRKWCPPSWVLSREPQLDCRRLYDRQNRGVPPKALRLGRHDRGWLEQSPRPSPSIFRGAIQSKSASGLELRDPQLGTRKQWLSPPTATISSHVEGGAACCLRGPA